MHIFYVVCIPKYYVFYYHINMYLLCIMYFLLCIMHNDDLCIIQLMYICIIPILIMYYAYLFMHVILDRYEASYLSRKLLKRSYYGTYSSVSPSPSSITSNSSVARAFSSSSSSSSSSASSCSTALFKRGTFAAGSL